MDFWRSGRLSSELRGPFGKLGTMNGRPMASEVVRAMMRSGRGRSGKPAAGLFHKLFAHAIRSSLDRTYLVTLPVLSGSVWERAEKKAQKKRLDEEKKAEARPAAETVLS